MSTVDYLQGVRHGTFTAHLLGAPGMVNEVKQNALAIYEASRHVDVTAGEAAVMSDMAAQLEAAARNLRNAGANAPRAPLMRLVAAE